MVIFFHSKSRPSDTNFYISYFYVIIKQYDKGNLQKKVNFGSCFQSAMILSWQGDKSVNNRQEQEAECSHPQSQAGSRGSKLEVV